MLNFMIAKCPDDQMHKSCIAFTLLFMFFFGKDDIEQKRKYEQDCCA